MGKSTGENKRQFYETIDSLPVVIFETDPRGTITFMNTAVSDILGYTREELIGQPFFKFMPLQDGDRFRAIYRNIKTGQYLELDEFSVLKKDGSKIVSLIHTIPYKNGREEPIGLRGIMLDISRQKKIESELRRTEAFNTNLLNCLPNPIILVKPDKSIEYVNPALEELTGYTKAELIGLQAPFPWWPQNLAERYAREDETLNRAFPGRSERLFLKKNGEFFWAEISVNPMKENDRITGYLSNWTDITIKKTAEQDRNYQALLVDNVFDAIISTDLKHVILSWNKAAESLFGWKKEEVLGKTIMSVIPVEIDPIGHRESKRQLYKNGHWEGEVIHKGRDGKGVNVYSTASWFKNSDGKPIGYVAVYHDTTEQKKAEQNLKYQALLVDNVFDVVIFTDLNHHILSWNKAAENVFGWKEEEVLGKTVMSVIPAEMTDDEFRKSQEQINKIGYWKGVSAHKRRDGASVNVYSMISLIKDNAGIPLVRVSILHDITEQKKAEQDLSYQALLVDSIFDAVVSTDINHNVISWNKAAENIFGWKEEEALGKSIMALTPIEMTEDEYLDSRKKLDENGHWEGEYIYKRRDGVSLNIYSTVSWSKDSNGKPIGHVAIFHDMTEQKKAAESLERMNAFNASILENTPHPIIVYNPDDSVRYVNPAFEKLTGYTVDEILNTHAPFPYWTADKTAEYLNEIKKDLSHVQEHTKTERYFQKKTGEPLWIEIVPASVRDKTGQELYNISIWTDVTNRKKAADQIKLNETRLESLLRISQYQEESEQKLLDFALEEAIKLTQSEIGYIFYYDEVNKEFVLNTFSQRVYSECSITDVPTVWHLDKTGIWGEAVRQKKSIIINDFAAPNPLKKGLPLGHSPLHKFMTTPVFDQDKIVAVIGVANKATDYDQADELQLTLLMDSVWKIVEKHRVSEELKAALLKLQELYSLEKTQRQELEEEAKSRGMFLNIVGHELRTPLTPLIASSAMLKEVWDTPLDEIKKRLMDNIHNSASSLGERLEELLDLARFSRGTFTLKKQPFDLNALLRKVAGSYQVLAEQQKKNLTLELLDKGPDEIEADPARLEQVLNNLLSNAIKFSPENTAIILRAHRLEDKVIIEVQDQGIGISTEEQKNLFQPYHRVEQDRRRYPGIGLGLAVCKQIVEAHGGKILIQSKLGKGAKFVVHLPVK